MTAFERLVRILEQRYKIPRERVRLDAPLAELGVDSLGMAEMLFFLEDEFKIALPREPPALVTVGDALRCVESLVEEQRTKRRERREDERASSPSPSSQELHDRQSHDRRA